MLLLVLNLAGTFAFGLSGGMAGVRARLDFFGVVVLAVVVGLAAAPAVISARSRASAAASSATSSSARSRSCSDRGCMRSRH